MDKPWQVHIDQDIFRCKLALSQLSARRNSYSLISRLPDELLASIFIHYARYYHYEGPTNSTLHWVQISYICSRWRNVALNCPVLWSFIFVPSQHWMTVLLARSRPAPLKIHLQFLRRGKRKSRWWSNFVGTLLNHVERIEEIRLDIFVWDDKAHELFSTLFSSIPHLQSLELFMNTRVLRRGSPDESFGQQIPVPWNSYKLDSLTTLNLHSIPPFQQDLAKFLVMLNSMQHLAHLYLDKAFLDTDPFTASAEFGNFQKISLPHLSCLFFCAPVATIIAFLSCVNIPTETKMKLYLQFPHDHRNIQSSRLDDSNRLCTILAQHYNNNSPLTIRSMLIRHSVHSGRLVFATSAKCDHLYKTSPQTWNPNIPLTIIFPFCYYLSRQKERIPVASYVCSALSVTTIRSLWVIYPMSCPIFWRQTFGCFTELRHIKLSNGDMPDLGPAVLSQTVPEPPEENSRNAIISSRDPDGIPPLALEELELHYINIHSSRYDNELRGVSLQSLSDALSRRGMSPVYVTMTNCRIDGNKHAQSGMTWLGGGEVGQCPSYSLHLSPGVDSDVSSDDD